VQRVGIEALGVADNAAALLAHSRRFREAQSPELRQLYRLLGANAGRHAKGATPVPARNPYTDEAIEARYHTSVIALVALERDCADPSAAPEDLELLR